MTAERIKEIAESMGLDVAVHHYPYPDQTVFIVDLVGGEHTLKEWLAFEEAVGPTTSTLSSGYDFPHLYMTFPKEPTP
jgi:hypothetical protein